MSTDCFIRMCVDFFMMCHFHANELDRGLEKKLAVSWQQKLRFSIPVHGLFFTLVNRCGLLDPPGPVQLNSLFKNV